MFYKTFFVGFLDWSLVPQVEDFLFYFVKNAIQRYLSSINLCLFLINEPDAVRYQPWKQVKPLGPWDRPKRNKGIVYWAGANKAQDANT